MPIYEYRCEDCRELTEVMQRFGDPPPAACPRCGGTLRKQISAPAFQFKGSGWYVTDYARKAGGTQESGGEGDAKPAKAGDGEGKKEGKKEGNEGKQEGKAAGSTDSGGSGEAKTPAKAAGGAAD